MKKIYIYKVEVLRKHISFQGKVVNYVKLTRPEGLEEHWPKAGDIINIYLQDDIFYTSHKVIDKNCDIYIIESSPYDWQCDINIKVKNLKDEGLESLLNLPRDINDEIKGLSTLSKDDIDPNMSLNLYLDFDEQLIDSEIFYEYIKNHAIRSIKDKIKNTDVLADQDHCGIIEIYSNEPTIEEVIDKYSKDGFMRFKGIIEKEFRLYRIYIRTNIYKKEEKS